MMDEGHTVDVIYLDFAKAFDFANNRLLFVKVMSLVPGDVVMRSGQVWTLMENTREPF